jgi:hypothetical protein
VTKARLKDLFESIGVIAIVASLIFVGLQLQQERELMRSELGANSQEFSATIDLAFTDPDMSAAWAKMLDSPEDLTLEEMLRVNGVLQAVRRLFLRECYLLAMDVFGECDSLVRGQAAQYFGNKYAQAWWKAYNEPSKLGGDPYDTRGLINEVVTSVDTSISRGYLEHVKAGL